MVRFRISFIIAATVPALTSSGGFPRRLALELSKATGLHVKEQGEHPVDCEWLYTGVDSGILFPECSISKEQLHIRYLLLLI